LAEQQVYPHLGHIELQKLSEGARQEGDAERREPRITARRAEVGSLSLLIDGGWTCTKCPGASATAAPRLRY
jgi:hypothetical protein